MSSRLAVIFDLEKGICRAIFPYLWPIEVYTAYKCHTFWDLFGTRLTQCLIEICAEKVTVHHSLIEKDQT